MSEKKEKQRECATCRKKFTPTPERRLTCEHCYHSNSNSSPYAEEPEPNARSKKAHLSDDSIFRMIRPSPTNTARSK